tara:strand:+ start:1022 stop:1573 length:552 start_codon:yes stop_codon:yes gene_type:complete
MDNITIPVDNIIKNGLSINEYLILYNTSNNNSISGLIDAGVNALVSLESKGFIKLKDGEIYLRNKSSLFFEIDDSLFLKWLNAYPTTVKRKYGGKRALSPANLDTILGKKLKKKWISVFKKDIESQKKAIKVLELQVKEDTKSGNLEYFVEASRWLNEGYHEKYSYLLDEEKASSQYENEDYI